MSLKINLCSGLSFGETWDARALNREALKFIGFVHFVQDSVFNVFESLWRDLDGSLVSRVYVYYRRAISPDSSDSAHVDFICPASLAHRIMVRL